MSLTSSLYSGVSGLTTLGNAMQVIGDNVANVNTVGFKSSTYAFSDLLSQAIATQSGTAQVGRGVAMDSVDADFSTGSLESTGNTTDLSIGGDGFFIVVDPDTGQEFYTRAGNFSFDKYGQLVTSEGYIVQGWQLDSETGEDYGAIVDIIMQSFTSPPEETSEITVITNLDADQNSLTEVLTNAWNGLDDEEEYIDGEVYEYQTVVTVYDSLGSTHDLTIYYDKQGDSGSTWEYMICCDPSEDQRNLVQGTSGQGILARGEITFSDSTGTILDFTMEEFTGRIGNIEASGAIGNDNATFTIENYDALPSDGYGFSLEFDGTEWTFEDVDENGIVTANDLPENYPNAEIVSGDENSVSINLDGDSKDTVDLVINFSVPAQATDSIKFDIIDPDNIQIQDVINTTYTGDAANAKTDLEINNPSVLTTDAEDVSIIFDASENEWYWSSPELQNIMNANTTGMTTGGTGDITATETVLNADVMGNYSEDIELWWNEASQEWEWRSDYARDLSNLTYNGGIASSNVDYAIEDVTELTEYSTGNVLYWNNIVGVTNVNSDVAGTTLTVYQEENLTQDSSVTYVIEYDGANWNWVSTGDPAIDLDYTNRQTPTSTATSVSIDLTGDGEDFRFDFTGVPANGDQITFTIDEDGQWTWAMPTVNESSFSSTTVTAANTTSNILNPAAVDTNTVTDFELTYDPVGAAWTFTTVSPEYPAAVITAGDENHVTIDLDADGTDDIEYTFETPLVTGAGATGSIFFSLDVTGNPPSEYSSATILAGSDEDILMVDLTGNGVSDVTWAFTNSLTANGSIEFDIDTHIPPAEYENATIDSTNSTAGLIDLDLNGDGYTDVRFEFEDATGAAVGATANSSFVFDIDPRVPPEEYPNATIDGNNEKVELDMDGDGEVDITFTFDETTPLETGVTATDSGITFDIEGTTAWTPQTVNSSGYYEFSADFLGGEEGSTVMDIVFDIGTRDDGSGNWLNDSLTTTQYAQSSNTTYQTSDGYGAGDLESIDVSTDGSITGVYSNGELIPLFRVALAKFLNNGGLYKIGGNLYRETRESGEAITSKPGTNGLGSISPNSLELSNVDVASEFVDMITTQRGFQANSKIVTTVDEMLAEVINMKR